MPFNMASPLSGLKSTTIPSLLFTITVCLVVIACRGAGAGRATNNYSFGD
jgi:hypothetical protein